MQKLTCIGWGFKKFETIDEEEIKNPDKKICLM